MGRGKRAGVVRGGGCGYVQAWGEVGGGGGGSLCIGEGVKLSRDETCMDS